MAFSSDPAASEDGRPDFGELRSFAAKYFGRYCPSNRLRTEPASRERKREVAQIPPNWQRDLLSVIVGENLAAGSSPQRGKHAVGGICEELDRAITK